MMYSRPVLEGAIDAHAHFVPGAYRDALLAAGIDRPDGFPHIPEWSVTDHLAHMDELGIAASLISISSPGVHFGDDQVAAELARAVNESGAEAVATSPRRFGHLASLPLPDVDAALVELAFAFDELKADGVVLMTNVAGTYPGDPAYAELWAELDRRAAVVVLHPASPPGWERTSLGRPRPMIEFPFDTTRCVVDLALGGTLSANPNVKLVVPHVGSALPVLVDRVAGFTKAVAPGDGPPVDVIGLLAELHYDVAGDATPRAIEALLRLTTPERLLFGSDFPFPPRPVIEMLAGRLLASEALDQRTRPLMLHENAGRLFPRLAPVRVVRG